jgi:hypothetical protein
MNLDQFYHIARASCAVAAVEYVTVFGSNAILPWLNDMGIQDMRQFLDPDIVSRELDLCVGDGADDELNLLVDGTLGELSQFDETFGVYAHPNPIEGLFQAPPSWQKRIRIDKEPKSNINIVVPHYRDLAVSKIIAGRPKDLDFALQVAHAFDKRSDDISFLVEEYMAAYPDERQKVSAHLEVFKGGFESAPTPQSQENS